MKMQIVGKKINNANLLLSVDTMASKYPSLSPYVYCANNPIKLVDPDGMEPDIVVTTKSGKELFRLNDGKKNITTMSAKQLYAQGIQWFEPTADNYMPLISVSPNIKEYSELKHFSWQDLAIYSNKDRSMLSYRSGGSGDWKHSGNPGDGYLMVSFDGMPFWTDAIGQIPFAVKKFRNELKSTKGNIDLARQRTIEAGMKYGNGSIFSRESDFTNSYDNAMIRRGINWAENSYYYNKNKVSRRDYPPQELSKPSNELMLKKY